MTSISIHPFEKRYPSSLNVIGVWISDKTSNLVYYYFIQFYRKVFISLLKNLNIYGCLVGPDPTTSRATIWHSTN